MAGSHYMYAPVCDGHLVELLKLTPLVSTQSAFLSEDSCWRPCLSTLSLQKKKRREEKSCKDKAISDFHPCSEREGGREKVKREKEKEKHSPSSIFFMSAIFYRYRQWNCSDSCHVADIMSMWLSTYHFHCVCLLRSARITWKKPCKAQNL